MPWHDQLKFPLTDPDNGIVEIFPVVTSDPPSPPDTDFIYFYGKGSNLFFKLSSGIIVKLRGFPPGHIDGGKLSFVSTSSVKIGTTGQASSVRNSPDTFDIEWSGELTAAITSSGAGGLDTGTEASNTWYAVHVIGDTAGLNAPAALLSLSATGPTLPAGYDVFRRLGWVRNDPSSNFLEFIQKWNGRTRRIWYLELGGSTLRILTNGNATSFTSVSAATLIAPTSSNAIFSVAFETGSGGMANNGVWIRPTGSTLTNPVWRNLVGVVSSEKMRTQSEIPTDTSQSIDYKVADSNNAVTIYVAGFDDEL